MKKQVDTFKMTSFIFTCLFMIIYITSLETASGKLAVNVTINGKNTAFVGKAHQSQNRAMKTKFFLCLLNISVKSPKDNFAVLYFQRFLLVPVLMLKVIGFGLKTITFLTT